jgi:hypothetical protein
VRIGIGVGVLAISSALAFRSIVRVRHGGVSRQAADVLFACAGAGLGAGALVVQRGARPIEWVVTLAVLGILTPVHVRLLMRDGGPFRL